MATANLTTGTMPTKTVPIALATLRRGRISYSWSVQCPFCSLEHTHAAGSSLDDDPRRFLSSRVSHCRSTETRVYLLVETAGGAA